MLDCKNCRYFLIKVTRYFLNLIKIDAPNNYLFDIHLLYTFCLWLSISNKRKYIRTKYGNQIKNKSLNFGLIGKIVQEWFSSKINCNGLDCSKVLNWFLRVAQNICQITAEKICQAFDFTFLIIVIWHF